MKKVLSILLCLLCFLCQINIKACAKEFSLSAQACVLYCVENESVIFESNADKRMKPASTTKIMTTLLALEKAKEDDVRVKFDESMIEQGSSMYLKVGDVVHLSSLAKGMMMASGNDAANAVALTLCDSMEDFALLMNKRAEEIGMNNTHFVTPSGLDDENHYTTAIDMAKLMSVALDNKAFADITKNKSMEISFLTPQKEVTYANHNRLLSLYEYCIGGKTGYTQSAGRCLVSAARKDDVTLVCVTFNADDDWNDHIKMYDYGFERYKAVDTDDSKRDFSLKVVGAPKNKVSLYCKTNDKVVVKKEDTENVTRTVYVPQFVYAPIKPDEFMGMVIYELDGKIIAQNPLYSSCGLGVRKNKGIMDFFEKFFK